MSSAESCSYIGIISYFSYEVRHSFMGDRLVTLEGKTVKKWNDEMLAHPIKSVEMYATGGSVVAGLVPATKPWYGISPRISTIIVSTVWVLTQIMQLSLMKVSVLSAKSA